MISHMCVEEGVLSETGTMSCFLDHSRSLKCWPKLLKVAVRLPSFSSVDRSSVLYGATNPTLDQNGKAVSLSETLSGETERRRISLGTNLALLINFMLTKAQLAQFYQHSWPLY